MYWRMRTLCIVYEPAATLVQVSKVLAICDTYLIHIFDADSLNILNTKDMMTQSHDF
jgi:hypothetical protein